MNDIIKAMEERRSIRKFKADMPSKDDINQIIEAGLYAASGMGRQGVITVAITNKKLRDELADDNRKIGGWQEGFDPFYGAPVVLVVLADTTAAFTWKEDGSLVMGNLLNAAHAKGLGSCWIHRAKEVFETEEGKAILRDLGIDDTKYVGIGNCILGYVNGDYPEAKPRKENYVYWIE